MLDSFADELLKLAVRRPGVAEEIEREHARLSKYRWAVPDAKRRFHDEEGADIAKVYRTLSPEEFHKHRAGTCWDYVEAQRDWFEAKNIPHRTFYIEQDNQEQASHTVLVYKTPDGYLQPEASWKDELGISRSKDEMALVKRIANRLRRDMGNKHSASVYEYQRPSHYGMDVHEFMAHAKQNDPILTIRARHKKKG